MVNNGKNINYDKNNVFAKILRGEIPANPLDQNENTYSFADINPQAPQHHLVIPKGAYKNLTDFAHNASDTELAEWVRALAQAAELSGITDSGYRVIVNCGEDAHQEVPHLHGHVLGGKALGPLLNKK